MVGIDIVDLRDPLLKPRTSAHRFISHPEDSCFESENAFWFFWTAKEAVFKAHRELTSFAPKEIPVRIKNGTDGAILFEAEKGISGQIFVYDDLIISVASTGSADTIGYHFFEKQTKNDSQEARQTIKKYFAEKSNLQVQVTNDGNGLPMLDHKNLPVSISHHGRFIAFAYPEIW